MATDYFTEIISSFGFQTECPEFICMDWKHEGAHLTVDGTAFEVFASPYSLGCQVSAPLDVVSNVSELVGIDAMDNILLLRGDIAKEQLMPKNFTFFNPDHHKRIISLLEATRPKAIIAATKRNPELAGGMYPFPLIEDGDFDIPCVYMTDKGGDRLVKHKGREVSLEIQATRIPSKGCNVIARKGGGSGSRIVLCAHIDAKDSTPGALDNATGIIVLLLLAELLENYSGNLGIEIVALNGEDHYSAQGQKEYVKSNEERFTEIMLSINIDVAGYIRGNSAYSMYDCPDDIANLVHKTFSSYADVIKGEPWYQSDHMIFVQNQVPALAITSDQFVELSTNITHTPKDSPDLVDCEMIVNLALSLRDLLVRIE